MVKNVISIDIDSPSLHRIKLGADEFDVRAPKAYVMVDLARLQNVKDGDVAAFEDGMKKIVQAIFQKKDSKTILARLRDPQDPLDFTHVVSLAEKLMELVTENPTMSA